jgi:hypothetical protein
MRKTCQAGPSSANAGNEPRINEEMPHQRDSAARRLYDLLDTLVAMRSDFGTNAEGKAAALTLGPEKIEGIRKLLDQAIASTKDIIGELDRPPPG